MKEEEYELVWGWWLCEQSYLDYLSRDKKDSQLELFKSEKVENK